ncbi:MAG: hypothetical protein AB1332_09820 [Pseudomonadota bacterium]
MITTIGNDTIKTLASGQFRCHRKAAFWIGDYPTYAQAARALQIANSEGASDTQRGFYDGGVHASDEAHLAAVEAHFAGDLFGPSNPVTLDDVARTILAGEPMTLIAGLFPVKA